MIAVALPSFVWYRHTGYTRIKWGRVYLGWHPPRRIVRWQRDAKGGRIVARRDWRRWACQFKTYPRFRVAQVCGFFVRVDHPQKPSKGN